MSDTLVLITPTRKIAMLNDLLRTTMYGGTVCVTAGVYALGEAFMLEALTRVREFNDFNVENDPHEEHDFGEVQVEARTLFWKIDYFEPSMVYAAEDPSDPRTQRVLTIMLEEDY